MAIAFKCTCGRSMKVRDENAGKKVRCPACGAGVLIPVLNPSTDDEIRALKHWAKDTDRVHRDPGKPTPHPPTKKATPPPATAAKGATPLPKTKPHRQPDSAEDGPSARLVYIGVAVGAAVFGALVWFIWLR